MPIPVIVEGVHRASIAVQIGGEGGLVTEKRSKVLLAGIGRGPFEAIAPVLERQKLEIERVDSPEAAVEMACSEQVALIIFDAEPNEMSLEEVVEKLRADDSASAKSSLLVMAEPAPVHSATARGLKI